MNIDAPSAAVVEMERQMRINEDILRFMTVRVDELEEGPSAMMQKRDRTIVATAMAVAVPIVVATVLAAANAVRAVSKIRTKSYGNS